VTPSPTEPSPSLIPGVELTLFVSGASGISARAIESARLLCDVYVHGGHLEVVDLNDDPAAAFTSGVLASPTLVRNLPLPIRRYVGDVSDLDRVLRVLELPSAYDAPEPVG
jgi:circadian clock protein KaiB